MIFYTQSIGHFPKNLALIELLAMKEDNKQYISGMIEEF